MLMTQGEGQREGEADVHDPTLRSVGGVDSGRQWPSLTMTTRAPVSESNTFAIGASINLTG
jgi:hypothetical protein